MILPRSWFMGVALCIALSMVVGEDNGPAYDTSDWIPIVPDNKEASKRESKSSDRILNVGSTGEKFVGEEKLPLKKSYVTQHKQRRNPHIKRSPNQRPRIKIEQPYRFENILSPPPKQDLRTFQQKNPYQQTYNLQPQYQFNLPKPSHIPNQETYQPLPVQSNPSIFNLDNLQANQGLPHYSTTQLGVQYQQPSIIHQALPVNDSIFQQSGTLTQGLFENVREQNIKLPPQGPPEDKDTVQLLYVPLEQLQQQGLNPNILDEAFKSLQQQKLVAPPPESDQQVKQPEQPRALPQQGFQQNFPTQQKFFVRQNQPENQKKKQQQYQVIQDNLPQNQGEQPKYYQLVSNNQEELILQNNPKTSNEAYKQDYQVQAEKQQIVELTSPQPIPNHQSRYNSPFENQKQHAPVQNTRNTVFRKEPQQEHSFQNQVAQPFSLDSPKLQQSYIFQNQPEKPIKQSYFQNDFRALDQKSRLQSIQNDIRQQTLQVEKLQKQIQQGKSIDFQGKNTPQPQKKRKPHQPPLAVYMEGNQPGDVEAVLEVLKNAKSIAVQDRIGPNSPQVFIGPSNLNVPEGFAKFPLPYLSSLDNGRIQRKAQQFPFFVAPVNYKEPEGYSKIPLPSPHVGSVVVSQFKQKQIANDNFQETNRPVAITNYQFVNPSAASVADGNSHFEDNLNAYSLESSSPRDNTNKQLKEQTLFQQITGFSGFDYPQNQYFAEERPNSFGQVPEVISPKPHGSHDQYLEEVHRKPEPTPSDELRQETPIKTVSPTHIRQRTRGERVRGNKNRIPESTTETSTQNTKVEIPEIPTPNIIHSPEKVEISSQNPLTQDFFNRFSSNNNFNFNYVSSTPGYAIPTQSSNEELPANIRKLPNQHIPNLRDQQDSDAQFEQSIQNSQNTNSRVRPHQEEKKVHIYNQYEQYELPPQFTDINPNLPGLINELQQNQYSNIKYETDAPPSTTPSTTTQYTVRTTEATTTTTTTATTTTRKSRGRGRSRFNMRTTTSFPLRRNCGERRRPCKNPVATTTESTFENSYRNNKYTPTENERNTRLQNTLTERVAEGSVESTSTSQQLLQPITRVMDISQNQPNYFMEFQSDVANVKPISRDYEEEPRKDTVRQYQSQKVTTAEELASQKKDYPTLRKNPVIHPDRSEQAKQEVTQSPYETEVSTRKRVRVRGRPKNKYSSTTIAPRTTAPTEKDQEEFYGFFRQPNFSQSSQISSSKNEEESIHIYPPTQQKPTIYNQRNNDPVGPSSPRSDTGETRFVGEIRPKYASPSRATTTQTPETTQRTRIRGRVRVPGRNYENKSKPTEGASTERNTRVRTRGRTHFTPPRNTREEVEDSETENYPASYLKSRETPTTPSSSEFKITVSTDEEKQDQVPYSSINIPEETKDTTEGPQVPSVPQEGTRNYIYNDEYEVSPDQMEIVSFRGKPRGDSQKGEGFRVVNLDQFDTAESQNYRTLFNSLDTPYKVNELKSKEIEETTTTTQSEDKEETTVVPEEVNTTTETSETGKTSIDDLNSTILESVRESIGNSTVSFIPTTTISAIETTTEDVTKETQDKSSDEQTEIEEITSTLTPEVEMKSNISTASDTSEQTPLDLLNLQTSTSTEVSHETEICYKGRCVKSKNRKFRKRLLRKKVNETNV